MKSIEIPIRIRNMNGWIKVQDGCFKHGIYWKGTGNEKYYPMSFIRGLCIIICINDNRCTLMTDEYINIKPPHLSVTKFMKQNIINLIFDSLL